jgi:hypothetical protein
MPVRGIQSRSKSNAAAGALGANAPGDDLSRAESVATAIRRAFPLPESGAFADLLAALEDEPQA